MNAIAYLSGVLAGDGTCGRTIQLRVKDQDFAETFAVALEVAFGVYARPSIDQGYWRCEARNDDGRFNEIREYAPQTDEERSHWLRGLFDSEGNAQLRRAPQSPTSWARRVAIYSTNMQTLQRASRFLGYLGIGATIRPQKASATHLGSKQVYELSVGGNREHYLRFAWLVSSSIDRKRRILNAIGLSYVTDIRAAMRAAQQLGAAKKHEKTMNETLPRVVAGVRSLIDSGVKPTQRACQDVRGFSSIQRYVRQVDLVAMARAL